MRLCATLSVAAIMAATVIVAANAEPYGRWVRASTGATIEFYDCSGKLCAKIAAVTDASKKGNVGKVIMQGAAKSGAGEWKGELLNLEDGKTYSGVITEAAGGLNLKGCVLGGIICKDETLSKAK